jgi:hypothetical protein
MGYGFSLPENPHDSISLKLPNDETLYMITRNILAPENLVEKFQEVVTREREKWIHTPRKKVAGYHLLLHALVQKLGGIGWDRRYCDTYAGKQAEIYRVSQQDLLMCSYAYIVGLYREEFERAEMILRCNVLRREGLDGEKKRQRGNSADFMVEWFVLHVLDKKGKFYSGGMRDGLMALKEDFAMRYEGGYWDGVDEEMMEELKGRVRSIRKKLKKRGVKDVGDNEVTDMIAIWEEESIEEVRYPDVYEVVERLKDDEKAIVEELQGESVDMIMFIEAVAPPPVDKDSSLKT